MSILKELRESLHRSIINEGSDVEQETGNDSVDEQIDKYFMSYENEASNAKNEGLDYRSLAMRFLTEVDDEKKPKDMPLDDEPVTQKTVKDLDIRSFAYDVARLIDNAASLLEFRSTIARRAINFLNKNYDDETLRRFRIILEDDFDIVPGETQKDREETIKTPGAGAAGTYGDGMA